MTGRSAERTYAAACRYASVLIANSALSRGSVQTIVNAVPATSAIGALNRSVRAASRPYAANRQIAGTTGSTSRGKLRYVVARARNIPVANKRNRAALRPSTRDARSRRTRRPEGESQAND